MSTDDLSPLSGGLSAVQVDRLAAANLRRLRIRAGLSAERLSLALGVARTRIRDIEQGSERLPVDILVGAARVLSLPLDQFFKDPPGSVEVSA